MNKIIEDPGTLFLRFQTYFLFAHSKIRLESVLKEFFENWSASFFCSAELVNKNSKKKKHYFHNFSNILNVYFLLFYKCSSSKLCGPAKSKACLFVCLQRTKFWSRILQLVFNSWNFYNSSLKVVSAVLFACHQRKRYYEPCVIIMLFSKFLFLHSIWYSFNFFSRKKKLYFIS